jgi:alkylated DNA repair dioxygenase AlkB
VIIIRRWRLDHEQLLAEVRPLVIYRQGDNRATAWLDDEPWLAPLLDDLERRVDVRFTSSAFQAYRDGWAACGWHNDPPFDTQAILSLGASRLFGTRRAGVELFDRLDSGDLLFMPSGFQDEWEHCVPPEPAVTGERISLVFRTNRGV